ncbi:hypothetical protein [Nostoc sp.]|uniref:hypothetical protein n=1 Tax=Nostoc sp. TaxID=1180 RepID=UPI002FF0AEFF
MVGRKKPVKKTYTTSIAVAEGVLDAACEMGVSESAVINFALRDWLMKYRKEQYEAERQTEQLTTA